MGTNEITVDSVTSYIDAVNKVTEDLRLDDRDPWFRGQRRSAWKLLPSFYRAGVPRPPEHQFFNQFLARSPIHRPGLDSVEQYFLARHYGLPTRILDWTESALFGLYFSLHQAKSGDPDSPAVFVLNPYKLNEEGIGLDGVYVYDGGKDSVFYHYLPKESPAYFEVPVAVMPTHIDHRVAAQMSRFVIFGLEKVSLCIKDYVRRILIKKEAITELRRELHMLGITPYTLKPDLGGLCEDIVQIYADSKLKFKNK